jgi:hypothetical protein
VSPTAGLDSGEEKHILLLPGIKPWRCSPQPITIPAELFQLPFITYKQILNPYIGFQIILITYIFTFPLCSCYGVLGYDTDTLGTGIL